MLSNGKHCPLLLTFALVRHRPLKSPNSFDERAPQFLKRVLPQREIVELGNDDADGIDCASNARLLQ
jgi:hypothetical protein